MSKARLFITAVLIEGRNQSQVALGRGSPKTGCRFAPQVAGLSLGSSTGREGGNPLGGIQLSKLVKVPLREVWKHEALDFTQWLALPDNLALLGEMIGIELVDAKTEEGVGKFYVDIVAKDENGHTVVIENQLESTNHDHLGKIITYAAGVDAEVVVWIVEHAREEHEQAVNWLNEHTTEGANFFLLQIEAWKIDASLPAPRFNVIAKPNDWAKTVKQSAASTTVSDLKLQQQAFFEQVRQHGEEHALHIRSWRQTRPQYWYDVSIGSSQAHIRLLVQSTGTKQVVVSIYIPENQDLFNALNAQCSDIEGALGVKLDWQDLPKKKASRIEISHPGDFLNATQSKDLVAWIVATADRFAQVFPKYLQRSGDLTGE